jgi:hypothetical protein
VLLKFSEICFSLLSCLGLHTGQYNSSGSRRQTCPHSGQQIHLSMGCSHTGHFSILRLFPYCLENCMDEVHLSRQSRERVFFVDDNFMNSLYLIRFVFILVSFMSSLVAQTFFRIEVICNCFFIFSKMLSR